VKRSVDWAAVAGKLCDLAYLQARTDEGQAYDLLLEMETAAAKIPANHSAAEALEALVRSLRRNVTAIAQRPALLFQCFWNDCWWRDCAGLDAYAETFTGSPMLPGEGPVSRLMEAWRAQRAAAPWVRSVFPPAETFGDQLLMEIRVDTSAGYVRGLAFREEDISACFRNSTEDSLVQWIWNTKTGQPVDGSWPFPAPSVSPDGRYEAVCGSWGEPIRIRDKDTGAEVEYTVDEGHNLRTPVFSADGTMLAAAGYGSDFEGLIYFWRVDTGQLKVVQRWSSAEAVAFSPDGRRYLAAYANGLLEICHCKSHKVIQSISAHSQSIDGVAFSDDGKRVASIGGDGFLRIWDLAAKPTERRFAPHADEPAEAVFSPDGGRLVTRSMNGTVWLWDGNTGRPIQCLRRFRGTVQMGGDTWRALYVGNHMIVSMAAGGGVWKSADGERLANIEERVYSSYSIEYTLDGKRFARWCNDSFREETAITVHDVLGGALEDGDTLQMSMDAEGEIRERRLRRRIALARIETDKTDVAGCTFSMDQSLLAAAGEEGWLKVWDWQTGTEVYSTKMDATGHRNREVVRFVDRDTLVVALDAEHIRLVQIRSGEKSEPIRWAGRLSEYPRRAPYAVDYMGAGFRVVSAENREEVASFPGPSNRQRPRITAHPNGRAWVALMEKRVLYFALDT
jgi:WD40 repeat protein